MTKTDYTQIATAITARARAIFAEHTPRACPDFALEVSAGKVGVKVQQIEFRSLALVVRAAAAEHGYAPEAVKFQSQLVPASKAHLPPPRRRKPKSSRTAENV